MPNLIYDSLNINEAHLVNKIIFTLSYLTNNENNFHKLTIQNNAHFFISPNQITNDAGWYIIIDGNGYPFYIGTAENLNNRLNTPNGTRDNFLNPVRASDSIRNFIKKYSELEIISELFVLTISENDLRERLQTIYQVEIANPLSDLDRNNIEKILSIYRGSILNQLLYRIRNILYTL